MSQHQSATYTLELSSKPNEIVKVEKFLEKVNKSIHLGDTRYNKLLVATTEAVNNGIIHGNKRDPQKKVTLTIEVNSLTLIVRVQDEGPGVDPSTIPDPLAEENLMRENGRGVFLMRSLMDDVAFDQSPGRSRVVMKMNLED